MEPCPYVRVRKAGGEIVCGREAGHKGPHFDKHESELKWVDVTLAANGAYMSEKKCAFSSVLQGLPYMHCAREQGHEGAHCTESQLNADWHLPGAS